MTVISEVNGHSYIYKQHTPRCLITDKLLPAVDQMIGSFKSGV